MKTTMKDSTKAKNHVIREVKDFNKTWLTKFKTKLGLNQRIESNTNTSKIECEKDSKHHSYHAQNHLPKVLNKAYNIW